MSDSTMVKKNDGNFIVLKHTAPDGKETFASFDLLAGDCWAYELKNAEVFNLDKEYERTAVQNWKDSVTKFENHQEGEVTEVPVEWFDNLSFYELSKYNRFDGYIGKRGDRFLGEDNKSVEDVRSAHLFEDPRKIPQDYEVVPVFRAFQSRTLKVI